VCEKLGRKRRRKGCHVSLPKANKINENEEGSVGKRRRRIINDEDSSRRA
jgi:hypothetical protein